jgi:flagellar hook-associated protein 1 FlgK
MLGLFGTLSLGQRSLQTQRQGVEVAGHNLANVNNPAYARQRLAIQTSLTIPSTLGPQGSGVDAVAIVQLRNQLVDRQLSSEISVTGYWQAMQQALQYAQADLGQQIDRNASGAAATDGVSSQQGLSEGLSRLFSAFQSLATNPTSLAERQVLLLQAEGLAAKFQQVDQRLTNLRSSLDASLASDVATANQLIEQIAKLNQQVLNTEMGVPGIANDLRDIRQQKLEELARLVNLSAASDAQGSLTLSLDGVEVLSGQTVFQQLETYDAGGGVLKIQARDLGTGVTTPLNLTSGTLQGTIQARDEVITPLQTDLNTLATWLIRKVNDIHAAGYALTDSAGRTPADPAFDPGDTTGRSFFTGTNATDIAVNAELTSNPSLLQASSAAGAPGNNGNALRLAALANQTHSELGNQTFGQRYGRTVAGFGQALATVNNGLSDQRVVEDMLRRQRDSTSGVSLDEEMTDLLKYQKAYEASARLITTIDEMLDTILNMKR